MIYFPCQACERGGGHCPEHPLETCVDCGLEFTDDSDWSGSAHGPRECVAHLRSRLATSETSRANMRLLLAEVRDHLNSDSEELRTRINVTVEET